MLLSVCLYVCMYVCAPRYRLNGWTDCAHVRYHFSITDQYSVNINIPAQETGTSLWTPKKKKSDFLKCIVIDLIRFQ
jgi:hypothetical protein